MEKEFDCRVNWTADDEIEKLLEDHFDKFGITPLEVSKNFSLYTRRVLLKRFLAHYELFQKTINLPGDIVELGVYRGTTLMHWANFLEIRNMGDRHKQVFGFDNFQGFTDITEKDGAVSEKMHKTVGGYNSSRFEEPLEDAISIFDKDRFIPYKARVKLIKGNIEETVPQFVKDNPGLRISLIHFDCDMYTPTMTGLKYFFPLVVKGGVVLFDEYGIRPWEGESNAVDEYFEDKDVEINRFDWTSAPAGYIIKK